MEINLEQRLRENGLFGMIKNVEILCQRIAKKFSMKTSRSNYDKRHSLRDIRAQKLHMLEIDYSRSQALVEAQHHSLLVR